MSTTANVKLSMREKVSYGLGDMSCNLVYQAAAVFLLIYYTDVFGILPIVVSALFLVARIWDAVNDPIMGFIVDRTNTKHGRFRPYLLWGALPLTLITILLFFSPDLSDTGKVVYAFITYIGFGMVYTFVNVPYGALNASLSQDPVERTSLSAARMIAAVVGGIVVIIGLPELVALFGNGSQVIGYRISMIIISVIAGLILLISFKGTKERIVYKEEEKIKFKDIGKILKFNRPLVIVILFFFVFMGFEAVSNASQLFFVKYNMGDEELFTLFALALILPMLVITPFVPGLTRRFGKKPVFIVGALVSLVSPIAILIISPTNLMGLFITRAITGLGYGTINVIMWAFIPDTVEYGQYKTGKRNEGMIYAIIGFSFKFGLALGGLIPGVVLQMTGYVPNTVQTQEALLGIRSLVSTIPIILTVIGIVLIYFYNLDEKKYANILKELEAKKVSA